LPSVNQGSKPCGFKYDFQNSNYQLDLSAASKACQQVQHGEALLVSKQPPRSFFCERMHWIPCFHFLVLCMPSVINASYTSGLKREEEREDQRAPTASAQAAASFCFRGDLLSFPPLCLLSRFLQHFVAFWFPPK
jgi:hypothetical protein